MTPAVYNFVKGLGLGGRCLDVGSYDVNGSVRDLFADYTGLDARPGPNVDVVADITYVPMHPRLVDKFDVITCLEVLEHCQCPATAVVAMYSMLRPSGTLVITVPGIGFPRHDYPSDYWRFTKDGILVLTKDLFNASASFEDRDHVYYVGVKT